MGAWVHNIRMADVKIRKLPNWVLESYRTRAKAAGRSLEEELRLLLTETALQGQREFAAEAAAFRGQIQSKYGLLKDSTPGIREDRERRG